MVPEIEELGRWGAGKRGGHHYCPLKGVREAQENQAMAFVDLAVDKRSDQI